MDYEKLLQMVEDGKPWLDADRTAVLASAKRMIRYDESLVPRIGGMEEVSRQEYADYTAIQYRFESWTHMYGAATLYLPESKEKLPLVFVCCGHGEHGRLSTG